MSTSTLMRWAGVAGLLSGLFLAINALIPVDSTLEATAGMLSGVLGLYVLAAVYLGQREASGAFGAIAYIVNSFGLALAVGASFAEAYVLLALDASVMNELIAGSAGLAFVVSLLIFNLGVVLFGIAVIRAGIYPAIAAVLYMVGFVGSLLALLLSLPAIVGTISGLAAAAGIVWFGYALWSGTAERVSG